MVPAKLNPGFVPLLPNKFHEVAFEIKDIQTEPFHTYKPGPLPLVVVTLVLNTTVPFSKLSGKGNGDTTLSNETLGNTSPLLVLSSSSNEPPLIFVGLSPIFIWALT